MIDHNELVREFHRKHELYGAYETNIHVPPDDVVVLRLRLMLEELAELGTALHEKNLIEIADALADLLYVVHGTALACGIPIDAVFAEVHRANMTKPRLDAHRKGGKISKAGYRPPRLGEILFPDKLWCPICGRELDVPFVRYSETATICGCGATKGELL